MRALVCKPMSAHKPTTLLDTVVGLSRRCTSQAIKSEPAMLMAGKGKLYPAFWGYLVHDGATLLTSPWLEKSQLPVVLDLDETLIVAHSASKLQQEIGKLRHSR